MIGFQETVLGWWRPVPQAAAEGASTPAADTAPRGSVVVRLLILVALYSIPAATVLRPLDEFDTWGHLRTGQWIVEHGTVPTTDHFSAVAEGRPWVAYSWLFEVLLYGLYACFGLGGIVLYRLVLTLVVVAVIHRFVARREPRFAVAAGLTAVALAALAPLLCERPWLFSIVFFTLTLDAVLDLRQGTAGKTVWLLPVWYVLWANLHIQFVCGLLVLALACAAPGIDRLLGRHEPDGHAGTLGSKDWWKLVGLTCACTLATVFNPYTWHLYRTAADLASSSAAYQLVGETRPLGFRSLWDWAVLGLTLAAAFALGRRRRIDTFEVLLLVVAASISFKCRRDLWLVVLAALAILTSAPRPLAAAEQFVLSGRRALAAGLGAAAVLIVLCIGRDCSERRLAGEVAAEFPARAAAVVEEEGYAGPLYNSADWGSYLMWRLPQLPVAIDGRFNLHGDERVYRFHRTGEGRPGWEHDPDLAAARVVILRSEAPLAELLRRDARFRLAHEDPVAVVFVARGAGGGFPRDVQEVVRDE